MFKKGHVSWNKGKHLSKETIEKIRIGNIKFGKRKGHVSWCKGKKLSYQVWNKGKRGLQIAWNKGIIGLKYGKKGKNHWNWRGGITPFRKQIWKSLEYKLWRKEVFERDDYTCLDCGKRGKDLEAHHLLPFVYFSHLRFNINNGKTLCKQCHNKINYKNFKGIQSYELR